MSEGGKSAISKGALRWDREGILGIDRDFEGVLLLCSLNRPFAVLSLEGTSPSSIANVCSSQHPSAAFDPKPPSAPAHRATTKPTLASVRLTRPCRCA